jgi:hypothetical protein
MYSLCGTFTASFTVEVSETNIKHLLAHAQCFLSYQIASVPAGQQLARSQVTTVYSDWDADSLSADLQSTGLEWNPNVH